MSAWRFDLALLRISLFHSSLFKTLETWRRPERRLEVAAWMSIDLIEVKKGVNSKWMTKHFDIPMWNARPASSDYGRWTTTGLNDEQKSSSIWTFNEWREWWCRSIGTHFWMSRFQNEYALLLFLLFFSEKKVYGENGSIVIYEANYRDQNTEHVTSNIKSPWQHRNQRHICNSTAVERQHESLLMSRVYPGRFLNSPLHDRGHFFLVQSINHPWYVTVQTQRSSI